ncbi:unnamed protein product [Lathyrus sativus]|nr:unnamed protein product [Lathyrus sativus]
MEINLGKLAFDIDFHPSDNLVATGLIDGDLHLYRYSPDNTNSDPVRVLEIHAHTESCRAARFISGGRALLTGSPDFSILATDVETGSTIARLDNAHEAAINRLINLTESTVASGDDDGCIKVWDTRERSCCNSFEVHEDYISDITFASDAMKLLATSGDGTLSVCSLRRNKVYAQSSEPSAASTSLSTSPANIFTFSNSSSQNNGSALQAVKTRICNKFNSAGGCKFGDKCHFAHGEWELGKPFVPSIDDHRQLAPTTVNRMAGRTEAPSGLGTTSFGANSTAKISVEASLAGAIIGKGGVNSKQICRQTGVKFSIRDRESDPNLINIELEGTFDQIAQASNMVKDLLLTLSVSTPTSQPYHNHYQQADNNLPQTVPPDNHTTAPSTPDKFCYKNPTPDKELF